MVFPAQLMAMEGDGPEIGSAVTNSGKSLQCTARKPYSYSCVLSGGQVPIANGMIAIFHFKIRTTAEAGTTILRIERAVATTVDSKELHLNEREAIVNIRTAQAQPVKPHWTSAPSACWPRILANGPWCSVYPNFLNLQETG